MQVKSVHLRWEEVVQIKHEVQVDIASILASTFGAAVGGTIALITARQHHRSQLEILKAQHKTEFMAEETARHFLLHKGYTDRSFELIKRHLGGFNDDELRKILVRAGAIRVFREDGSEWWSLLERQDEKLKKKGISVR